MEVRSESMGTAIVVPAASLVISTLAGLSPDSTLSPSREYGDIACAEWEDEEVDKVW